MSPPIIRRPDSNEGFRLFRRLIEGDKTASADLAAAYVHHLTAWLIQTNPKSHEDECCAAADEAIINLLRNPSSYDPDQRELFAFLQMAAQADLRNLLAKEKRHRRHRRDLSLVELGEEDGKYPGRDEDPSFALRLYETQHEAIPAALGQDLSDIERQVLYLMKARERRTIRYAQVMGIADQPTSQQKREVKRIKDRLNKRLERAKGGPHESS